MPATVDDPKLRIRLARVVADCGNNYAEAGRSLGLSKHIVRRLLLQPHGPIAKTRSRVELALSVYETKTGPKHTLNATETTQITVPKLAEEVLRYVLQAVEAQREPDQRA